MCGKEGRGDVIKDHIEANHLEGMEFPCDICGKTSRTRNALNVSISRGNTKCSYLKTLTVAYFHNTCQKKVEEQRVFLYI